jgi:hypothetical protein
MSGISRRKFFGFGLGAAAVAGLGTLGLAREAQADELPMTGSGSSAGYGGAIENAIVFQNLVMDAYATGATVRMMQSYSDQIGLESTAFTYDNAVAIHGYLLHGTQDSLARVEVLGQGLMYAQATNFPFNDGRFAQGYFVNAPGPDGVYVQPAAFPFYWYSSSVGDQAWAGMALAQLYKKTGNKDYLNAALKVANWIVNNTYNTLGAGGYSFGTIIDQYNQSLPSPNGKSTEHNIDTYAFFTMLDDLTQRGVAGNGKPWKMLAEHALTFVLAMYNSANGYFFTGTTGDQISINYYPVPEDAQTWSYLAMLNRNYKQTIGWALKNLSATDTASSAHTSLTGSQSFTGLVYDSASINTGQYDPNAVWLEGSAHGIAALLSSAVSGAANFQDRLAAFQAAEKLVDMCQTAQAELGAGQTVGGRPIPLGQGLVAATSLMDTGFGYAYTPNKHVGATGWFLIAVQGGNPFQLGYESN